MRQLIDLGSRFSPVADLITGSFESTSWTFSVKGTESRFCLFVFHQLVPMGPLFHLVRCFPPQVGFGSARSQAGVGHALVGWFRCFRPFSPRPLVLVRFRRPPLFFSLAFSGFARSGPGVLVCVSPSFLSCVPLSGPG